MQHLDAYVIYILTQVHVEAQAQARDQTRSLWPRMIAQSYTGTCPFGQQRADQMLSTVRIWCLIPKAVPLRCLSAHKVTSVQCAELLYWTVD